VPVFARDGVKIGEGCAVFAGDGNEVLHVLAP
jgi:hypothetical protein